MNRLDPTQSAIIDFVCKQADVEFFPRVVLSHPRDTAAIYGQEAADLLRDEGRVDFEDGSFLEIVQDEDEDGYYCRYERP